MFLFVSPCKGGVNNLLRNFGFGKFEKAIKAATEWAAVLGLGSLHVMSAPTCDG